jgi:hypothetical protein
LLWVSKVCFFVVAAVGGLVGSYLLLLGAAAALAGELEARLRRQVEQLLQTALAVGGYFTQALAWFPHLLARLLQLLQQSRFTECRLMFAVWQWLVSGSAAV